VSEKLTAEVVHKFLLEASAANLYPQVIMQLQKDIYRAGIDHTIDLSLDSKNLMLNLYELILDRLQNSFNEYLNLLYVVDVSEQKVRNITSEKIEDIASQTAFFILKREWQKVWVKNNF